MNILVINVARIGDTLLITPILRAIKQAYPHHQLGCLAHPKRMTVLTGLPFIDTLDSITPHSQWWRGRFVRQRPWDAALVYGQDAALIRYAARVATRVVAFQQRDSASTALLHPAVPHPTQPIHAVAGRMLLPEALGIHSTDPALAYQVLPTEAAWAKNWLTTQRVNQSGPLVGLQFTSFATKSYRDWPLSHFIDLAETLLAHFPGTRFFPLGDQHNRTKETAFCSRFPQHTVRTSGLFNLRESAAIMQNLDLYVGVDTGPTHLAGALGIPMVALYHCRFPGRNLMPLGRPHVRILEHPHLDDGDCSAQSPMSDIPVAAVWEAVQSVLAETFTGQAVPVPVPATGRRDPR
ncbi:MAG: glycosyltransferase family 9 protein [Magnetococcales bacterium]|nr:glycosyltransferase family 9 protein [Magnetococcales bacterium]